MAGEDVAKAGAMKKMPNMARAVTAVFIEFSFPYRFRVFHESRGFYPA